MKKLLLLITGILLCSNVASSQTVLTQTQFFDSCLSKMSSNSSIYKSVDTDGLINMIRYKIDSFYIYDNFWTIYSAFPIIMDNNDDTILFFIMIKEIKSYHEFKNIKKIFAEKYGGPIEFTSDNKTTYYWEIGNSGFSQYIDYVTDDSSGAKYIMFSILHTSPKE